MEIVNRSSLKEEGLNRKPNDYVQRRPHVEIDSNHDFCKLDKPGLYKGTLSINQKLPKEFLKELDSSSEEFVCYDPESEKIIKHFKSIGKYMTDVYELNLSDMSDELPSVVDTKYGTLDSIQKSLNSNLAQNPNLKLNSPEAIRARRRSRKCRP